MSMLLVGIALGIPVGILIKIWLDRVCEYMISDGWR